MNYILNLVLHVSSTFHINVFQFGFDTPVVATSVIIHLAVDGSSSLKSTASGISVFLIYEDGDQKDLGE